MKKKFFKYAKGFTLIELMVTVGIFVLLTGLLVAKYGTFNQGILLTNLAYDVALTLRSAQSYGLNVKSAPTATQTYSDTFTSAYGVHFDNGTSGSPAPNTQIIFFIDANDNKVYDPNANPSEKISSYTIQRGSKVETLCVNDETLPCATTVSTLDITFKRPDPDAVINGNPANSYAEIRLRSSDGSIKKVIVRRTGQIAVSN